MEYVITGLIARFNELDGQREVLSDDCKIDFLDDELPMSLEWNREEFLGMTQMEVKSDGIWAKMKIQIADDDLFRWDLVKKMTPCIGGRCMNKAEVALLCKSDQGSIIKTITVLKEIHIDHIGLCSANVDHSIKNIEQMQGDPAE